MNSLWWVFLTDVHVFKQNIPANVALSIQSVEDVDQFLRSHVLSRFERIRDSILGRMRCIPLSVYRKLFLVRSSHCTLSYSNILNRSCKRWSYPCPTIWILHWAHPVLSSEALQFILASVLFLIVVSLIMSLMIGSQRSGGISAGMGALLILYKIHFALLVS